MLSDFIGRNCATGNLKDTTRSSPRSRLGVTKEKAIMETKSWVRVGTWLHNQAWTHVATDDMRIPLIRNTSSLLSRISLDGVVRKFVLGPCLVGFQKCLEWLDGYPSSNKQAETTHLAASNHKITKKWILLAQPDRATHPHNRIHSYHR